MLNTEILYTPHNILMPAETIQNTNQKILVYRLRFRAQQFPSFTG